MDGDFKERLDVIFRGEVYGEAFSWELSRLFKEPEYSHKLAVLGQLEHETKVKLMPTVEAMGLSSADDPADIKRGIADAPKFATMSWRDFVTTWADYLASAVGDYEEAENMSPPQHIDMMKHVTLHEKAMLDFFNLEVEGKSHESLNPVLAILDNPPKRPA